MVYLLRKLKGLSIHSPHILVPTTNQFITVAGWDL